MMTVCQGCGQDDPDEIKSCSGCSSTDLKSLVQKQIKDLKHSLFLLVMTGDPAGIPEIVAYSCHSDYLPELTESRVTLQLRCTKDGR